jgi:hypothetical protein
MMQSVTGNTWKSQNLPPPRDGLAPHEERMGEVIQEIFKRIGEFLEKILREPLEDPQNRAIVLPSRGKAHLTNLKVIGALSGRLCKIFRNSELAITAYMVEHKAHLEKTGEWSAYLKRLQGFAKEEAGILANYLERELNKEKMIELLKGEMTEEAKQTFRALSREAFSSSETLVYS